MLAAVTRGSVSPGVHRASGRAAAPLHRDGPMTCTSGADDRTAGDEHPTNASAPIRHAVRRIYAG